MDSVLEREPKQLLRSTSLLSSSRHHASTSEAWRPPPSRDSTTSSSTCIDGTQSKMRKRHSFFVRSQSETPKLRRNITTLARTPNTDGQHEHWHRPGTATSTQSRRSKTEPLETLRNSIFGGKRRAHSKRASASSPTGRSGSQLSDADTSISRVSFKTEEDCKCELRKQDVQVTNSGVDYHHLRKASISPPFNFEHVTHTARKQLPSLETVNEQDLKAEFWGASAYQRPKHFLNGIQAEDLSNKLPRIGVERHSPSSRPTSPVPRDVTADQLPSSPISPSRRFFGSTDWPKTSIDETLFDEVRETNFDPDVALQALRSDRQQPSRLPKRYSSMGAIRETRQSLGPSEWPLSPTSSKKNNRESYVALPPPPVTFYESENSESDAPSDHTLPRRETPIIMSPSTPGSEAESQGAQQIAASAEDIPSVQHAQSNMVSPQSPESGSLEATCSQAEHIDRSKQPLPPVPTQHRPESTSGRRASQSSICMSRSRAHSTASLASSDRPASVRSKSSKSTRKSPVTESNVTSTTSIPTRSSILSDLTWEDDVDYLYEQNAESTCNFDWQQGPDQSTLEQDVVRLRLSGWDAGSSTTATNSPMSARKPSGDSRIASLVSQEGATHSRGSSVGHRGFLAARKGSRSGSKSSSLDALPKPMNVPQPLDITPAPALEITPTSPPVNVLSPVLSIGGEENSAAATAKPLFSPNSLHFHNFDRSYRGSEEYISDPESNVTRRSKHSKSSSYGSYDSATRSTPSSGSRDMARWSSTSSGSVPELMHSHKRRSKASLHKSIISRPLESLPQSPGCPDETESGSTNDESAIVPRASQIEPMRNTFVMRRPETTSDRLVLQNAGRAVQRGRPSTPGRLGLFPRIPSAEEVEQKHRRAVSEGPGAAGWL